MKTKLYLVFCYALLCTLPLSSSYADEMILVVGAGGTEEYAELFGSWADSWKAFAQGAQMQLHEIGRDQEKDYERIQSIIVSGQASESTLWIVLLGHGTFDRDTAKFNLRGKDIEAKELGEWLRPSARPMVLINGFSCSGAFLKPLTGPNRIVMTATKSGAELNLSRFAGYLGESLTDDLADLDHDHQVSLLEAFLLASSKVNRFYEADGRLVTEHALLEDNQDAKGISADFFTGIRVNAAAKDAAILDGSRTHRYIVNSSPDAVRLTAEQSKQRDAMEAAIEALRTQKSKLPVEQYYAELELLLLPLAELYQSAVQSKDATQNQSDLRR